MCLEIFEWSLWLLALPAELEPSSSLVGLLTASTGHLEALTYCSQNHEWCWCARPGVAL